MRRRPSDRRHLVWLRNANCLGCLEHISDVRNCVIVGPDADQRLVHAGCFVRATQQLNPTFSRRLAKTRL